MTQPKAEPDPLDVVIESITMHMTYAVVEVRFPTSKPVTFNVPADYAPTLMPFIGQRVGISFHPHPVAVSST